MKRIVFLQACLLLSPFLSQAQSNPAFMLDSSFGTDGKVVTPQINTGVYQRAYINSMLLQNDGKIVAAGSAGKYMDASYDDGVLTRYLPNGNIDTTFGNKGIVYTDYMRESNGLGTIGKQSSGKIVAINGSETADHHYTSELVRYTANGAIDSLFGNNGWLMLPISVSSLVIQTDDKIVVCGQHSDFTKGTFAVRARRYFKNGKLDSAFGTDGMITVTIPFKPAYGSAPSVATDHLGRIVIGFYCTSAQVLTNGITIARLTGSGVPDTGFNGTGISFGNYVTDVGYFDALCIQPDNKIVAGSYGSRSNNFVVTRFNENGTEDKGFGINGEATTDFTLPHIHSGYDESYDVLRAISIQNDGKIVAVGYASKLAQPAKFAVARYMPDGSADSSFGFAGRTVTEIEPFDNQASAVAIQPDGNIIAAGYSSKDANGFGQGGYFALARYLKKKKTGGFISGKSGEAKVNAIQIPVIIYPNPTKNVLLIKGLPVMTVTYEITDEKGSIVQSAVASGLKINVSALPAGIFYLKIMQNKKVITLRFVKE